VYLPKQLPEPRHPSMLGVKPRSSATCLHTCKLLYAASFDQQVEDHDPMMMILKMTTHNG